MALFKKISDNREHCEPFSNISQDVGVNNNERRTIGELATKLTFLRPESFSYVDVKIEGDHSFDGIFIDSLHKKVIFTETKSWKSKSKGGPMTCWSSFLGIDAITRSLNTLREKEHYFWSEFLDMFHGGYTFSGLYHFIQENGEGIFFLKSYNNSDFLDRIDILLPAEDSKGEEKYRTPIKISSQQLRGILSAYSPEELSQEDAATVFRDFLAGKLLTTSGSDEGAFKIKVEDEKTRVIVNKRKEIPAKIKDKSNLELLKEIDEFLKIKKITKGEYGGAYNAVYGLKGRSGKPGSNFYADQLAANTSKKLLFLLNWCQEHRDLEIREYVMELQSYVEYLRDR